MRKTLSVFLISGTMSLIAIGSAVAASVPAAADTATVHQALVLPSPSGRPQAIMHPSIVGPTISGYSEEGQIVITAGSGFTPGGLVGEGIWTGSAWSAQTNVRADSQGNISTNSFGAGTAFGTETLYGYDWTTGTFTPPVPIFVRVIP